MFIIAKIKNMKCLICRNNFSNQNIELVKHHYIDVHKVDKNNRSFMCYSDKNNIFSSNRCLRCGQLSFNKKSRRIHNFLKHYCDGSGNITEVKPLNYTNLGYIEIYEIKFSEDKNNYNFYNSDELTEEFLKNARHRF